VQCSRVSDAFSQWSERYGRAPRLLGLLDAELLRRGRPLRDESPEVAAREIASVAVDLVRDFDRVLRSRTDNRCGCQIGNMPLKVDARNLLMELKQFRDRFLNEIAACPVNDFLQVRSESGRLAQLADSALLDADARIRKLRDAARDVVRAASPISCRQCATVGDPIIALEQPPSWILVHVDQSFNHLCAHTKRRHKALRSNASFRPNPRPADSP
jgi:hypothetical protein